MARNGVAGGQESPATLSFAAASLRDLFAGSITSLLAIAYGLSFAALIFSGPLTPWLAYGITATFLTTAISAAVVAARSSIPFMIAGPDGATAAVTATLVAALAERLLDAGVTEDLYKPALIVMGLGALLTGLLLCILGLARAGSAIRFVPYPVIGGFLGATGWLMASGAVRVITGQQLTFATLEGLLTPGNLAKLAAAAAIAVSLYVVLRRPRSPFVLPGILIGGLAITYVALLVTGKTLEDAQNAGWMFEPLAAVGLTLPWAAEAVDAFPWRTLPALSGEILAVMFVTAITTLLNTTGIEFITRREADLERELKTLGAANLLSGALGGYPSCVSLSRSTLNYQAGGRGRLCGLIVAAVAVAVLAADPSFIGYVPRFILGGLLVYLGFSLMYVWFVQSAQRLSWLEYASLLAIAFLIVQWGFIAGVLIGVVIGCATFAVSASRVNAIKFSFDGSEYRSSLDRAPDELAILRKHGHEIQGMTLQSYLFFGSSNRLYRQVKALFAKRPDTRFMILDLRLVTGIDSSAVHSFTQVKQAADEVGVRLVLVNVMPAIEDAFAATGVIGNDVILAPDLDRALEVCEVVATYAGESRRGQSLRDWLSEALGDEGLAEQLAAECTRLEIDQDEIVAPQGSPADCMHFILEGRVGIIVAMDDGRSIRVRSLGPHTTIGEMGLITRQRRSATIQAEVPSVLYALSVEAYERIKTDNHGLAQALLTYIVTVMSERLSFASRLIGVLGR